MSTYRTLKQIQVRSMFVHDTRPFAVNSRSFHTAESYSGLRYLRLPVVISATEMVGLPPAAPSRERQRDYLERTLGVA